MPNYRNDSRSSSDEQWSVSREPEDAEGPGAHRWCLTTLRSDRGRYCRGLHCNHCDRVIAVTDREWLRSGQRTLQAKL